MQRAQNDALVVNQAVFFDEPMHYVRELGAWPLPESLDPGTRAGPICPFVRFVSLTIMGCVSGVQSMLAMRNLLLTGETVADDIVRIAPQRPVATAAQGVSPEQLDVALDTTDDGREVPLVKHDKRLDGRTNRHARKVEGTVFGWEAWIV